MTNTLQKLGNSIRDLLLFSITDYEDFNWFLYYSSIVLMITLAAGILLLVLFPDKKGAMVFCGEKTTEL